jgi:branched-chain amino acid transport system ATP-binding protein
MSSHATEVTHGLVVESSSAPVLELEAVSAAYGPIEVLHGVDLTVGAGQVVALLGPNGGGKSTTLKVAAGLLPATAGDVRYAGRSVIGVTAQEAAALGVCLIPEGRGVFANLTVRENLWLATGTGSARAAVEEAAFARFPILADRRNQLAGSMSGGEQQMLALSRALASDPVLLLLDELSMGLAPMIVTEMYETVSRLVEEGISVLVAEQFARTVLPIADVAAVMLNGRITAVGSPADIAADLETAYLGA